MARLPLALVVLIAACGHATPPAEASGEVVGPSGGEHSEPSAVRAGPRPEHPRLGSRARTRALCVLEATFGPEPATSRPQPQLAARELTEHIGAESAAHC